MKNTAIIVYGVSTCTGIALTEALTDCMDSTNIYCIASKVPYIYDQNITIAIRKRGDFTPPLFKRIYTRYLFVSLAPIWVTAQILESWSLEQPDLLRSISKIVVCSSSSAETKRYSFDLTSKQLSRRLLRSETLITTILEQFNIPLHIIRPTMIWGSTPNRPDGNISTITSAIQHLPVICLPNTTGLRQPIYYKDLANLILYRLLSKSRHFASAQKTSTETVGGDQLLTVYEILQAIKRKNSPKNRRLNLPIFISIPSRLYYFLALPVLLVSLRTFAAILRISSDMAGFTRLNSILPDLPTHRISEC